MKTVRWNVRLGLVLLLAASGAVPAAAQSGNITHWVSAAEFRPRSSNTTIEYDAGDRGYVHAGGSGDNTLWAPLDIPDGAKLTEMRVFFWDSHAAKNIEVKVTYYQDDDVPTTTDLYTVTSSGSSSAYRSQALTLSHTVDNYPTGVAPDQERLYVINVDMGINNNNIRLKGVRFWWQRQVSPAPANASFCDVPTNHTFFKEIEALYDAGVTSGCSDPCGVPPFRNFCPNDNLSRGQMAAFLSRALGLHWAAP